MSNQTPLQEHDELDSILIHQKDKIMKAISNCSSLSRADSINTQLRLVRELWFKANYTYKLKELKVLLKAKRATIAKKESKQKG